MPSIRSKLTSFFIVILIASFYSCNPDCESSFRATATVTPIGSSILVATSPPDFLKGRKLYVEEGNGNAATRNTEVTNYDDSAGGHLVELPTGIVAATANFYIEDKDCGGFIPLNTIYSCETLSSFTADITPNTRLLTPGVKTEVLITTAPADFLKDKKIFVENVNNNGVKSVEELPSTYRADAGGSVVTVPGSANGRTTFLVEDETCGGFVPLNSTDIVDEDYALNNRSLFVIPAPPQVVLPNIQVTPPPGVIQTWFNAVDRDYCLWIVPDTTGTGDGSDKPNLVPGIPELFDEFPATRESGTREISVNLLAGCGEKEPTAALYHFNPGAGVIDQESGYVSLSIDRTSKGLDIERYEGFLIDPTSIQAEYQETGGPCSDAVDIQEDHFAMMVLTSQKTGNQIILYRYLLGG